MSDKIGIFIIDGKEPTRTGYTTVLKRFGYDCDAAESLERGLEKLPAESRVILVDHGVKDMPLPKFIQKCREKCPGARVIGMSDADRSAEFSEAGINRFIRKPISMARLREMIAGTEDADCSV